MCHTDPKRKGTVTLEAALCAPVLLAAFLFLYGLLEMFLLYNCVSKAMYDTVDVAASYGVLYHKNGVNKLEKKLQDKLSDYLDLSLLLPYGDDLFYEEAAEQLFTYKLEQDAVYRRFFRGRLQYEFTGSRFFNGNAEIVFKGRFQCDYAVPFLESLLKGFVLEKTVTCNAFTEGTTPEFAAGGQETNSIWSLSNFERGKILQEKYGRNLPQFFPVIDYYRNGKAGIIRSINHTLPSYRDDRVLERVLDELYTALLDFEGGSYAGTTVQGDGILEREILLIFPEDDFTAGQQAVVERFVNICRGRGVNVTVERYGRTDAEKLTGSG